MSRSLLFFLFNDTATTEIYTLSLHDALPIFVLYVWLEHMLSRGDYVRPGTVVRRRSRFRPGSLTPPDRKSTRLNSSHANISYAVFCLKKKTGTSPSAF